jgi:outer membrane protein TolC
MTPGVPAPYLLTLDLLFPIETAGKRALSVERAQSLGQAAQIELADSIWTVTVALRRALLDYVIASRSVEFLRSEQQARADQLELLNQVRAAGESTTLDIDPARLALSKTTAAIRAAERQLAEARVSLAAAIGVPFTALDGTEFSWPELEALPAPESLPPDRVQRDAVINRLDIRRALAQYAATEADLRLEIAKQYPSFNIGPGYTYEERHNFFTVGLSISLPIFNRNEGPIAEAEGRRKEAAAAFLQLQERAIERSEGALVSYRAALEVLAESESAYQVQDNLVHVVERNIHAGSNDRMNLDAAKIQLAILAQARLDALTQAQRAFGELEDSVQLPLAPGEGPSIKPEGLR